METPLSQDVRFLSLLLLLAAVVVLIKADIEGLDTLESDLAQTGRPLPALDSASLATGDLVFLNGRGDGEKMIGWLTGAPVSHVAMVVVVDGVPHLWEADFGQAKEGARLLGLEKKLAGYKGENVVGVRRLVGREVALDEVVPIVEDLVGKKMDRMMWAYVLGPMAESPDQTFCSQLVATTLQRLGLLDKKRRASSFSPSELAFDSLPGLGPVEFFAYG